MTIDKASEIIKGPTSQIQNIRETVDIVFEKAKRICEQDGIEDNFPEKRRKQVKRHDVSESSDTGYDITQQQNINATEFWFEIETLKSQVKATTLFDKCECQSSVGLLKAIVELDIKEMFPNVVVAIKIFLTIQVTVVSCDRSFSKLKLIKTYLRSTMGQERLSGLAILSIERAIARLLSYENVIKVLAILK
ncbi:hypothetical protein KGM_203669 [Danaus plexippus plexippus]|uniref:HAT C-terminal dimerisation domain-containing protein n=1 Tax=Danaus plexippus plexippus TaxID=278856 RepID=A0A212FIZ0_DANPL|nr:hypothetical protein KGM_203669 [Danaus plexippus plexippus]